MMPNDIELTPSVMPEDGPGWIIDAARPVTVRAQRWRAGEVGRTAHAHPRGQLVWAEEGILRVHSCGAHWLAPTSHAVWIPGEVFHAVVMETDVSTCFIYIDPSVTDLRGRHCEVLYMTPLMRQLLLRFRALGLSGNRDRLSRLSGVIIDELAFLPTAPLSLPAGSDPRLVRVTGRLLERPDDHANLEELARFAGAGTRTLERLFRRETGLSFSEWRNRLRLMEAVNHLSHGKSSVEIASLLGYRSASAFVAAFRRNFGVPPQSYLKDGSSEPA
ncbi:AraC family transcriptional regulator [Martelella radicis]|uniref:AraC-like DNA-binding protein n=1 Tax=Martelella radicis TaxID=1397476 RepID=A0A7W6KI03_9HYPH|nr:helix-turn-helix transcriptional regulator [Martelella radicis]MBB4121468.1 AraC-like DNA-binding protein [Martelella radicis]